MFIISKAHSNSTEDTPCTVESCDVENVQREEMPVVKQPEDTDCLYTAITIAIEQAHNTHGYQSIKTNKLIPLWENYFNASSFEEQISILKKYLPSGFAYNKEKDFFVIEKKGLNIYTLVGAIKNLPFDNVKVKYIGLKEASGFSNEIMTSMMMDRFAYSKAKETLYPRSIILTLEYIGVTTANFGLLGTNGKTYFYDNYEASHAVVLRNIQKFSASEKKGALDVYDVAFSDPAFGKILNLNVSYHPASEDRMNTSPIEYINHNYLNQFIGTPLYELKNYIYYEALMKAGLDVYSDLDETKVNYKTFITGYLMLDFYNDEDNEENIPIYPENETPLPEAEKNPDLPYICKCTGESSCLDLSGLKRIQCMGVCKIVEANIEDKESCPLNCSNHPDKETCKSDCIKNVQNAYGEDSETWKALVNYNYPNCTVFPLIFNNGACVYDTSGLSETSTGTYCD